MASKTVLPTIPGVETNRQVLAARRAKLQAPIAAPRYQVVYLESGKEKRSPWLYRNDHATTALAIVQRRVGQRNAIIYVD